MSDLMRAQTLLFAYLAIISLVTAQLPGKICAPEPVPDIGSSCPQVCNDGCFEGLCRIRNPFENVICPDDRPCRVVCDGLVWNGTRFACTNVEVTCSKHASCDVIMMDSSYNIWVNCLAVSDHSCTVYCDSLSAVYDYACNATSACNCKNNCQLANARCTSGINCLGDQCFNKVPTVCNTVFGSRTMRPVVLPDGTCGCTCANPAETAITPEYCGNASRICNSDADCGFPLRGRCSPDKPPYCWCNNPWDGPFCDILVCDHCQNGGFCRDGTNECICTGLWTGKNCTERIQLTPSRPDNPDNVERCTSSIAPVAEIAPVALPISIDCPPACTNCSVDTDGTPVCHIIFPLDNETHWGFYAACPETHRCIFNCLGECLGYLDCSGPYPCDIFCQRPPCGVMVTCASLSSCRKVCQNRTGRYGFGFAPSYFTCTAPNGSCICDWETCPETPECTPGINCNGDICSGTKCESMKLPVLLDPVQRTCGCQCRKDMYAEVHGECYSLSVTLDCTIECKNGGLCREARCWCPPGWSGPDCSQRDSCVVINDTALMFKQGCSFVSGGVCFINLDDKTIDPVCPLGWPCVFICQGQWQASRRCEPTSSELRCPLGSGPCELWCWGEIPSDLIVPGKFRPSSACTQLKLICDEPGIGCRSICEQSYISRSTIPYEQSRTVGGIQCAGMNVLVPSAEPLNRCSSCGTDTCIIAENDVCYDVGKSSSFAYLYGFLPQCQSDSAGQMLIPTPNNLTNTCPCGCPPGSSMISGACTANGCEPKCENLGVCYRDASDNNTLKCRCFSGWTGPSCTSRCFFPVEANVTSCYNGLYEISGDVSIPNNKTVDLYGDVPDLQQLQVRGSVVITNNSTLLISPPSNWSSADSPTIQVSGNWSQQQGSILETTTRFTSTQTIISTAVNLNGTAVFAGGTLVVSINASDVFRHLASDPSGNISILLFSFTQLDGEFDDVILRTEAEQEQQCSRIVATPVYGSDPSNTKKAALSVILRIDNSGCGGVSALSAGGIAAIVVVAVLATGAIAVTALIPAVRKKVWPFFRSRQNDSQTFGETDTELLPIEKRFSSAAAAAAAAATATATATATGASQWVHIDKATLK